MRLVLAMVLLFAAYCEAASPGNKLAAAAAGGRHGPTSHSGGTASQHLRGADNAMQEHSGDMAQRDLLQAPYAPYPAFPQNAPNAPESGIPEALQAEPPASPQNAPNAPESGIPEAPPAEPPGDAGTRISEAVGDDSSGAFALPFNFPFFCDVHPAGASVFASTNGYLTFNADGAARYAASWSGAPDYNTPGGVIGPFWGDLYVGVLPGSGAWVVAPLTVAGRQAVSVEWRSVNFVGTSTFLNFQVFLLDDGTIMYGYRDYNPGSVLSSNYAIVLRQPYSLPPDAAQVPPDSLQGLQPNASTCIVWAPSRVGGSNGCATASYMVQMRNAPCADVTFGPQPPSLPPAPPSPPSVPSYPFVPPLAPYPPPAVQEFVISGAYGDDASGVFTLPFDFPFFCNVYPAGSSAYASTNGFVTFTSEGSTSFKADWNTYSNYLTPGGVIGPLWADLQVDYYRSVVMRAPFTLAGRQAMAVTWSDLSSWPDTSINFQAYLLEDGTIMYGYRDLVTYNRLSNFFTIVLRMPYPPASDVALTAAPSLYNVVQPRPGMCVVWSPSSIGGGCATASYTVEVQFVDCPQAVLLPRVPQSPRPPLAAPNQPNPAPYAPLAPYPAYPAYPLQPPSPTTPPTAFPGNPIPGAVGRYAAGSFPLPFTFPFFCIDMPVGQPVWVSTSGYLTFNQTGSNSTNLPSWWGGEDMSTPGGLLAPFWSDIVVNASQGAAVTFSDPYWMGGRQAVSVAWQHVRLASFYSDLPSVWTSFQVTLLSDGTILYGYRGMNRSAIDASLITNSIVLRKPYALWDRGASYDTPPSLYGLPFNNGMCIVLTPSSIGGRFGCTTASYVYSLADVNCDMVALPQLPPPSPPTSGTLIPGAMGYDASGAFALPMDFPFFCDIKQAGTPVWASTNGFLTFNSSGSTAYYTYSGGRQDPSTPGGVIAPFWSDSSVLAPGVYWSGPFPMSGRQAVAVEWRGASAYYTTMPLNFQVYLLDDGTVMYSYKGFPSSWIYDYFSWNVLLRKPYPVSYAAAFGPTPPLPTTTATIPHEGQCVVYIPAAVPGSVSGCTTATYSLAVYSSDCQDVSLEPYPTAPPVPQSSPQPPQPPQSSSPPILPATDSLLDLLDWMSSGFDFGDMIDVAMFVGSKYQAALGGLDAPGGFSVTNVKEEVVRLLYPAAHTLVLSKTGTVAVDFMLNHRYMQLLDLLQIAKTGELQPVLDYFAARSDVDWSGEVLTGLVQRYWQALTSEELTPGDVVLDVLNTALSALDTVQKQYAGSAVLQAVLSAGDVSTIVQLRANLKAMMSVTFVRKATNIVFVAVRRAAARVLSAVEAQAVSPQDFVSSLATLFTDLYQNILGGGPSAMTFAIPRQSSKVPSPWSFFATRNYYYPTDDYYVFVLDTLWENLYKDVLSRYPSTFNFFLNWGSLYLVDQALARDFDFYTRPDTGFQNIFVQGVASLFRTLTQLYAQGGCALQGTGILRGEMVTGPLNPYCRTLPDPAQFDMTRQVGFEVGRALSLVWRRMQQGGLAVWYFGDQLRKELKLTTKTADPFDPAMVVRSVLRYAIMRSKK